MIRKGSVRPFVASAAANGFLIKERIAACSPSLVLRRWRAWRITGLLPGLMQEFHDDRPPLEVLDCADAVVAYYEERSGRTPPLGLARRRTRECLRAGVCEGVETGPDRSPQMETAIRAWAVTGSPLMSPGNLITT